MEKNLKELHPPPSGQSELFNDGVPNRVSNEKSGDSGMRFQLHNKDDTGGDTVQKSEVFTRMESLVNSARKEIQKLINYNLSGQLQHFSYPSSAESQYGLNPQKQLAQHSENHHSTNIGDNHSVQPDQQDNQKNKNPEHIPNEILRRSYINPNFYSSTHSQIHSSENSHIPDTTSASLERSQHPAKSEASLFEDDSQYSERKENPLSAENELSRQKERISYLSNPVSRHTTK